ncbi:hypothetical protein CKO45_20795 [Paracraurococcus ruber]|uniref:HTH crp-type domain-containing protein n=2 Tax=Paracraurococcus ruber TaxID=77675 RepID=A0ABS1D2C1_9PROT|nr:hypothetical protein [Paracraurococcus ruber]
MQPAGTGNRVLDGLSPEDAARIGGHLERQVLAAGQILGPTGAENAAVLFPIGPAVVSVVAVCEDGRTAEAHSVGREGMLGPAIVRLPGLGHIQVQMPGQALRIDLRTLEALCAGSESLRVSIQSHDEAMMARLVQSAICASLHTVEARVSRWLLIAMERVGAPELPVTQELLSDLLGVRRTTVTRVMAQLTDKGLIRRRRSRVMVTDPTGLAQASCTCHTAMRDRLRRVAPVLYPD